MPNLLAAGLTSRQPIAWVEAGTIQRLKYPGIARLQF
jgi:hypothetical protein